ncbi:hypothetical protein BT63DRAFT_445793 [Microthyrium microscopicum]|uniref:SH3 domain-containing protein n=1 Tax=Microthyrium microscopicum TaxID=703497 RepID=A0A6A6UQ97_9PEZI|nr:hypothetical protein BT63DRAFT_445793 [Microthyrium microscopicum]
MVPAPPGLPMRFPCWVQAVYSWGGETKRDLGFIEGDLIECLNAGDGSWWTGRLRRDPRMVGVFPSNFVKVLDESYQPASRSPSPLPPAQTPAKDKLQKSKTWRKPFQAYSEAPSPNPEAAAREVAIKNGGSLVDRARNGTQNGSGSRRPYSSMARSNVERGGSRMGQNRPMSQVYEPTPRHQYSRSNLHSGRVSPAVPRPYSRGPPSPMPQYSRAPSPMGRPYSRGPSPAMMHYGSRAPSPNPYMAQEASPPPPPPPQHRYANSRAPSPNPMAQEAYGNAPRTPNPERGDRQGKNTPSPFTSAFNDIMDTFQDMTLAGAQEPAQPEQHQDFPQGSIWGPDDYEKLYGADAQVGTRVRRPHTSMATTQIDSGYHTVDGDSDGQRDGAGSQLDDYIPRMEKRLRELQNSGWEERDDQEDEELKPPIPEKNSNYNLREQIQRPFSALSSRKGSRKLKKQKSAYELATAALGRTFTLKSSATTTTNSSNSTNHTLWSGTSAGGMSSASAGTFYNKKLGQINGKPLRPQSSVDFVSSSNVSFTSGNRPESVLSGPSFHSSHATHAQVALPGDGLHGGLGTPSPRKSGFFRKMMDSARASAATARSTISAAGNHSRPGSRAGSPVKFGKHANSSMVGIAGGMAVQSARPQSSAAREMGLGGTMDWVQVRRDVHRSNSLSKNERRERAERCQMLDIPVIAPVEELLQCVEGDEGLDGLPVVEPTDFTVCNLGMVDKSARFVANLPPSTTVMSLVQGYLCRPYRSDVQRLRAIFTWVSERISWEEDFEGEMNVRRVLATKRGCTQEIALLVAEMCAAIGVHVEVVRGYLKVPGEMLDIDLMARPNHWWNTVIVDGEWRIMDCSLASPTNPRRTQYSTTSAQMAESWWFLARPTEICYTHVPIHPEHQHMVPPMAPEVLLSLPCACPPYFRNNIEIYDFDTSSLHLDNLELTHLHFFVRDDIELIAELEVRAFARDADGDLFESGDVVRKPALSQAEWFAGRKRFTIKAVLPSDEGQGVLKIYAGKRGLMHSIKSNPHPLALALPIFHTGQNPPYSFLTRHPTPHAQRHDLYIAQPQCARLTANNTFVFCVRQHPSSLTRSPILGSTRAPSPNPMGNQIVRPASAMSMASISASGSAYSNPSSTSSGSTTGSGGIKPAKLAVQTPSGKIIRLTRKVETVGGKSEGAAEGSEWETVIKVGERGTWRGLVLADRSARWCVFAEWECV